MRPLVGLCFAVVAASPVAATTFYVDPQASQEGTGTQSSPWGTLATALASGAIGAGDTIILGDGRHGPLIIDGSGLPRGITIRGSGGAHAEQVVIRNASGLTLDTLQVWPVNDLPQAFLVQVEPGQRDVVLNRLRIRGHEDGPGYRSWSLSDWQKRRSGGAILEGDGGGIWSSTITGVGSGIGATGDRVTISGNSIQGFAQDGIVALGDFTTIRGNRITDCIAIDGNHDDAIQSWSLGPDQTPGRGEVVGLRIEDNIVEEWSGGGRHPLRCSLQGFGLFDGTYRDLLIRNNVLSVSAYHGIGVLGAIGARVLHNTLVHPDGPSGDRPWISVSSHKDGRPSQGVVIANNAAPVLMTDEASEAQVRFSANFRMNVPAQALRAPYGGDYSPVPGGPLDGRADPAFVPERDQRGTARAASRTPDIGAIEIP